MSDNWIVQNLNSALQTWSDKLAEIWTLLTQSPENFKGGAIWSVMTNINGGLKAIGYGLLVLFFAAPAVYNMLVTIITGGVSMVIFFFVFKIIFPEGKAE